MGASSSKKKMNEQEPKKEVIEQQPEKKVIEQIPEKKVIEQEPKKIEPKPENLPKKKAEEEEEEEEPEPENYFYCLREREISYIEEKKEKKDKDFKSGKIQAKDKFYPLFRKFEIDLTKQQTTVKDILVLYIPKRYNKNTLIYEGTPAIDHMAEIIEQKEANEYVKYTKINNSKKAIKHFVCKQNLEREYASYLTSLEFDVSPKYKEENLVTIETCYKVNLNERYGLYEFRFYMGYEEEEEKEKEDGSLKRASVSFIFDDNYMPCHIYKDYFDEISKYKLYSFNKNDMALTIKDKRIKIFIESELDEEYLSKFTPDEINQINESLNKIEYHYSFRHLIYQKVIHNIKDKKDYIKAYFIVFYPHQSGSCIGDGSSPIKNKQPILVKRFTINNLLVKKEKKFKGYYDENEDEGDNNDEESVSEEEPNEEINEEDIDMFENGYYLSSHKYMEFYLMFAGVWGFYEFDCVSNDKLNYFQFNCNQLGGVDKNVIYGASYKYEIILNGHKIKFPNENIKYTVNNGKIVLQGFINGNKDNFDEKKYAQLAHKYGREWYLEESYGNDKIQNWAELRLNQFLPQKMELA